MKAQAIRTDDNFFEWIARAIQMDTKYAWEVTPGDWQNMFAMFINPYV